jgi:2'-5' RNA ligase
VTLRFFGEIDGKDIDGATSSLRRAASSLPAQLTAQGGPSTRFLGPGLVIWPVSGLDDAAHVVERATARTGKPPPDRSFLGHMTMARAQRGTDLRPARHLLAPLAISWPVGMLTLVRSELHPDGARYQVLEEVPLGPAGGQAGGDTAPL